MTATTYVKDPGTGLWKKITKIYTKDTGGTWRTIKKVYTKDATAGWQLVYNSLFSFSITNGTNINLRTLANAQSGWDQSSDVQITLFGTFNATAAAAFEAGSASPYVVRPAPAVTTGVFPGVLTVIVDSGCVIAGHGGNGGNGGGDNGHPGGHAFSCSMNTLLFNAGNIWGGGGGGSAPSGKYGGGGAGGGAGQSPGLGTAGQAGIGAGDGSNGTSTTGGAGGAGAPSGQNGVEQSYGGGAGGGRGSPGVMTQSQLDGFDHGLYAGAAGYAIAFNGFTCGGTIGATLGPVGN